MPSVQCTPPARTGPSRRRGAGRWPIAVRHRAVDGVPDVVVVGGELAQGLGAVGAADVGAEGLGAGGEPAAVPGGRLGVAGGGQFDGGQFADRLQHRPAVGDRRCGPAARRASAGAAAAGTAPAATGAPEHTSAAASRVPCPANTASRAKTRRSSGVSRSRLHSSAARSVACRPGAPRRPRPSRAKRSVSPWSTAGSGRSISAAAASSMASGMPSRWATSSGDRAAFSSVSPNPGRTRAARSTNSRTASTAPTRAAVSSPEGRRSAAGPAARPPRRRCRAVRGWWPARQVRAVPRQALGQRGDGVERCSQLSSISSIDPARAPRPAGPRCRRPAARRHPPRRATAPGTEPGVGQRGELDHPGAVVVVVHDVEADLDRQPRLPDAARADDGRARPVDASRPASAARSASRPTRAARRNGRLCATSRAPRGGKPPGRSGCTSWKRRPELGTRAAGRSRGAPPSPGRQAPAAAVAVASDIRTWPPCASADAGRLVHGERTYPPPSGVASPVCRPIRTRTSPPAGQAWAASAR